MTHKKLGYLKKAFNLTKKNEEEYGNDIRPEGNCSQKDEINFTKSKKPGKQKKNNEKNQKLPKTKDNNNNKQKKAS